MAEGSMASKGPSRQPDEPPHAHPSSRPPERGRTEGSDGASSWRTWVDGALKALVVLGLLVLGYAGHRIGWKIPRVPVWLGRVSPSGAESPWCEEHRVPEEICISCNPDLLPKGKLTGWCEAHGVAECVLDHPELAQVQGKPDVRTEDLARAERALKLRPRPANSRSCQHHLRRIQFVSKEAIDRVGIRVAPVERGPVQETIHAPGKVVYDPTRVVRLAPRAEGIVVALYAGWGDRIQAGQAVALLEVPEVGQAKAALLEAVTELRAANDLVAALSPLKAKGIVEALRLREAEARRAVAEANVRKALQKLVHLGVPLTLEEVMDKTPERLAEELPWRGLPPGVLPSTNPHGPNANWVALVCPQEGWIVSRSVAAGEVVEAGQLLMTVADHRRLWGVLRVREEEARHVREGQIALWESQAAGIRRTGRVTWISPEVDPNTRTVEVRLDLPNDDGMLKHESFGTGKIILRDEPNAIVVPSSAIHWEGCCFLAFVRDKHFSEPGSYKVFHTRMVRPGITADGKTEILAGLLPGEFVVVAGGEALKAELLSGKLGPG
jgi:cobalt-zinc-cadmium efflux system membrane fusion protein